MLQQLLMTKLFIPRRAPHLVLRRGLVTKWLEGYLAGRRVTLVCAPAGYGKTTLMLDFLQAVPATPAWLSLDEGDNDARRFFTYLCAALQQAGVSLQGSIETLLQDAGFHAPEALMTLLIASIAACGRKLILVLDDCHVIGSQEVHKLTQFLLMHQPDNLHLALLTREDPPLPLSRLRVTEALAEFRAEDLVFGREDAARLLEAALDSPLPQRTAERIADCTEGWAAGIKLYALAIKGHGTREAAAYVEQYAGTHAYIIDYLVEEVLKTQPEDIRGFLVKTSVLERMDGALCDALTGHGDGREMLGEVSRRNLFLVSLDDRREWFRYHSLFAGAIRAALSREEERALCLNAAGHMKSRGFDNEAVAYALRSGDLAGTLKLVEDSTEQAFRAGRLDTLLGWLEKLPDDMVRASDILCVRRPIACFITGRYEEAVAFLRALGPDFEERASPHNRGLINCLKALQAGMSGQDAEPFAREALRRLEPWDPIARTSALNALGRAQYRKGKVGEAAETLKSALASSLLLGHQFVTTLVMMNYSSCLGVMGSYGEALRQCEKYIEGMRRQHGALPPYAGILYVTMAGFYRALGEESKAEELRARGEALCKTISYDAQASLRIYAGAPPKAEEESAPALPIGGKLSQREAEILRLLGQGLSNGDIAKALFISTNTTQWHLSHLYQKLGVKSRTQAAARARELGLLA